MTKEKMFIMSKHFLKATTFVAILFLSFGVRTEANSSNLVVDDNSDSAVILVDPEADFGEKNENSTEQESTKSNGTTENQTVTDTGMTGIAEEDGAPEHSQKEMQSEEPEEPKCPEESKGSDVSQEMVSLEESDAQDESEALKEVSQPEESKKSEVLLTEEINPVRSTAKSKRLRVLLVGNSQTDGGTNKTIPYLKNLAEKSKRKLALKKLTANNEKMQNWVNRRHRNGKRLYREIDHKRWDIIVFQEQTQAATSRNYIRIAEKICKYIQRKDAETEIIFNCTWAYRKGKRVGRKYYTFSEMQNRMDSNCKKIAKKTGARICWSGKAFRLYRHRNGKQVSLYRRDNNHGSDYGWYLNACCLYASIFRADPSESRYYAGLNKKQAKILQKIAAQQCCC